MWYQVTAKQLQSVDSKAVDNILIVYTYDESEDDWVSKGNSLWSTFEATTLARGTLAISNDGNVLAIDAHSHQNCLSCEYISLSNE